MQKDNGAEGTGVKSKVKFKSVVYLETDLCKGCGFCVEFCPTHVLELGKEFNAKGYHTPRAVAIEKCSGCNLCGLYCPDFAIFCRKVKVG